MAHINQIRTFPATASLPTASTYACTSLSSSAKAGWAMKHIMTMTVNTVKRIRFIFRMIVPPYKDRGLAIKAPNMDVNSRRHQAFITSRNTCPPNILHQDLKMFDVL